MLHECEGISDEHLEESDSLKVMEAGTSYAYLLYS